ncbi:MAG: toll/interleukin-1 receptor domain-containing protein [Ekhidna sp.]
MAKKPITDRIELTKDPEQFKSTLTERIAKGNELLKKDIRTENEFEEASSQFRKWDKYNSEFLKSSFSASSNEYKKEYDNCATFVGTFDLLNGNPRSEVDNYIESFRTKINNLESLVEITELLTIQQDIAPLKPQLFAAKQMSDIEIFISHNSKDKKIADLLIITLRTALNLPTKSIRCTSVDGYKLPIGAQTDETLRDEIRESKVFLGLLSAESIKSHYVLFELGAAWGLGASLFPILIDPTGYDLLKGPITGVNAANFCNEEQIVQTIEEIGKKLGTSSVESYTSYSSLVKQLVKLCQENA